MGRGAVIPMARGESAAGEEFYRRLQLSLLLRVIMVTFLLGATIFIHVSRTPSFTTIPLIALYTLSGVTYFITLLSLLLLRWLKRFIVFSFVQIIWEILFVSALIYITGGIQSIFSFLYLLAIIMGGIIQYRRGAFLAAAGGALLYGIIIVGMGRGHIPYLIATGLVVKWPELYYNFFINLAAMFGTAVLSTYLTEKLRSTDVELKETKKDRDTLEALNENIIFSLSSGLVTLDMSGKITSFNRAAAGITGFKEKEVTGKGFSEIFPQPALSLREKKDILFQGPYRFESEWTNRNGETRNLEFRIAPLQGAGGEILGTLVIFNDVTETREMEQRLRKSDRLAAVGQLAAGMAHEIRNPLASISGSTQMLQQAVGSDDTSQRLMRIVLRETDRLNHLINDFLLFARPAARNVQKFNLKQLVDEMLEAFNQRFDIKTQVSFDIRVDRDVEMDTDPKLLQQILWNLVTNAAQIMEHGGNITIRASVKEPAPERDEIVEMEVEDTGPGIPEHYRDKIFDPFFTTREEGTGLGLSVVYRIVESMNGSIGVENVYGGGTRFVIWLPLKYHGREERQEGSSSEENR
ncbi:MAG: ATP-binding protein [bacterium]